MCFVSGIAHKDKIFRGTAAGVGNPVIYFGSKTGRDGIHGATMASDSFDDQSEQKRPTVQVGDPFTEKLLLEACLELMAERTARRDSGHGRGRADKFFLRNGFSRRQRDRIGPHGGAAARARYDAL